MLNDIAEQPDFSVLPKGEKTMGDTSCANCPLRSRGGFTPVSEEELAFIERFRRRESTLDAGAAILREGESSEFLFTLRAGWAFRYRSLSDGRRQILSFLLPGDFLGLQAELSGQLPHGVEALTPVRLCVFPRNELWDLYRGFPGLAYDLTWLSAHEELIVDENLLTVGRRSAVERIAMLLVHLYKRARSVGEGDESGVNFPLNQQHIADALGLSLVHTNKSLRRLHAYGLHELSANRLRILKVDALQNLAEYYALPLRGRRLI